MLINAVAIWFLASIVALILLVIIMAAINPDFSLRKRGK